MKNTESNNELVPSQIVSITEWHKDRNLIDGATDWSQTEKLFEEFIELVAAQMPDTRPIDIYMATARMLESIFNKGRIKSVTQFKAEEAKIDAIGDMNVVLINISERNQVSYEDCLRAAYADIKDRKGILIDGSFVKSSDLPSFRPRIEELGMDYDKVIADNT
ncbi:MazG-like pyrophosphatase [Vibrio phage D518]